MDIAVSPYHLTTREPPAIAALMLARRVVTMRPAPVGEHGGLNGASGEQTARRVPAYRRFIESWAWSTPLWKDGLITGDYRGRSPVDDMWAVVEHVRRTGECASLRRFFRQDEYPDAEAYLRAVAADLLKGGPDPGISLPVAAGIDRFAAKHGLLVARARAASLAQRVEAAIARPMFSVGVPTLTQASAERIVHARSVMHEERDALGAAVRRIAASDDAPGREEMSDLHEAVTGYAQRFRDAREELLMGGADDDIRVVEGVTTISAVRLPWDAVLTSSVRALGVMAGGHASDCADAEGSSPNLPALADGMAGRTVVALLIRNMGQAA